MLLMSGSTHEKRTSRVAALRTVSSALAVPAMTFELEASYVRPRTAASLLEHAMALPLERLKFRMLPSSKPATHSPLDGEIARDVHVNRLEVRLISLSSLAHVPVLIIGFAIVDASSSSA